MRVRYGISIVLLLTSSCKALSGYDASVSFAIGYLPRTKMLPSEVYRCHFTMFVELQKNTETYCHFLKFLKNQLA